VSAKSRRVRIVDPNRVYTVEEFRDEFFLRESSVRREVREARLRVSKRCGRYFLLGRWIIEWLEGGIHQPKHGVPPASQRVPEARAGCRSVIASE
jgi:hypothetical protein